MRALMAALTIPATVALGGFRVHVEAVSEPAETRTISTDTKTIEATG
jgi:hypothetical protein